MDLLTMKYAETISEKKNVMFRQPRVSVFFSPYGKAKTYYVWKVKAKERNREEQKKEKEKNKRGKKGRTKENVSFGAKPG